MCEKAQDQLFVDVFAFALHVSVYGENRCWCPKGYSQLFMCEINGKNVFKGLDNLNYKAYTS